MARVVWNEGLKRTGCLVKQYLQRPCFREVELVHWTQQAVTSSSWMWLTCNEAMQPVQTTLAQFFGTMHVTQSSTVTWVPF